MFLKSWSSWIESTSLSVRAEKRLRGPHARKNGINPESADSSAVRTKMTILPP